MSKLPSGIIDTKIDDAAKELNEENRILYKTNRLKTKLLK